MSAARVPLWAAALVLTAGFLWSLQGVTIRVLDPATTSPQIVYWRNLGQYLTLLLIVAVMHRGHLLRAFGRAGPLALLGGAFQCLSSITVIFAFAYTTVANVNFILSTAPFMAALIAWLILGEVITRRAIMTMAAAAIGVGVMMIEGLSAGHLIGNGLVIVTALTFSGLAVILRRNKHVDMLPTVCWGSCFGTLAGLAMTGGAIAIPLQDIALCMAMGSLQIGLGQALFILASRHVPAGPLALLTLSEIVLGPIWAWVGVNEVPSQLTLAGGAIVISALVWQALGAAKRP